MLISVHRFKVWGFAFGLRPHTQRSRLPLLKGVHKLGFQFFHPACLNLLDTDSLYSVCHRAWGSKVQVGHETEALSFEPLTVDASGVARGG